MLNHLTAYLLQFRSVVIPSVGTLQLVQKPAQLNVADKRIEPPVYALALANGEAVSEHQLAYIREATGSEDALQQLRSFGDDIRRRMNNGGFEWEGLGAIRQDSDETLLHVKALTPVPAQKVMREDAVHAVLVGDRETTSSQLADERDADVKQRRSWWTIIAWVVLVLAVLFIALHLYLNKFSVNATGSKLPPMGLKRSAAYSSIV